MSIASAIQTKQQQVAAAYTAASGKGATMPATENLTNLATCIGSIPSGGGSTKFGLSIDNFIGDVTNGVLGTPSTINGITFSGVTEIGNVALNNLYCDRHIVSGAVSFPDLITVGISGLSQAFFNNQITSVDLSALTTINDAGLSSAFAGNQITSVDLPALTTVGSYGMGYAFGNNPIQTIYFRALNSNSFVAGDETAFDDMLSGDENVTVHFPSNLQSVIGGWQSVIDGFGGENTTVLFDLPATN